MALAPPRASLASVIDDDIHLLPVDITLDDPAEPAASARVLRVPRDAPDLAGRDVVAVADDGPQWFRLRSLTVRGTATAVEEQTYRLAPRRVVAWDYGSLRDQPAEPAEKPAPTIARTAHGDFEPLCSPAISAAFQNADVMILASRSPKGTPFAVPLWFSVHHGRIYAATSAASFTVRNVLARPRVCALFGGERGRSGDRLLLSGQAEAVAGIPPAAVLAQTAWRYYLRPRFAADELRNIRLWKRRLTYYSQAQAAHLVITPQTCTEMRRP